MAAREIYNGAQELGSKSGNRNAAGNDAGHTAGNANGQTVTGAVL